MTGATAPAVVGGLVVAAVVAVLVYSEKIGSRALKRVCKPVASTGFVVIGVSAAAAGSAYARWVVVALAFGWLGDVLLLGRGSRPFVLGLGSFLLGHAAFGLAFVARGVTWGVAGVAAIPLSVAAGGLWRWLAPGVPPKLRGPVVAYLAVICAMVALAAGTAWQRGGGVIAGASLMFALSDVSVARDRFKGAGWTNKAWGLPLYYAAQCLLAASATDGR